MLTVTILLSLCAIIFVFILILWLRNIDVFLLAARNVFRNKRRSLLTLGAIVAGGITMVLLGGYYNGTSWGLRESVIRSSLGHIRLQMEGYREKGASRPTDYLIPNYQEVIDALQNDQQLSEYMEDITTEVNFSGIIMGEAENSVNYIGRGVDPLKEHIFSSNDPIISGSGLLKEEPHNILLGKGLASQLDAEVGNYVTILSTTESGVINAQDALLTGIIDPLSADYSNVIMKSTLDFAQSLVHTNGVNAIIIMLWNTPDTSRALLRLDEIVKEQGWNIRTYAWYELADFYDAVVSWFGNLIAFIRTMLGVLVAFFVLNTVSMSVSERFAEIGTLRSIGNTRTSILHIFLSEGVILGVFGIIAALALGLVFCKLFSNLGIMLSAPPGQAREVPLYLIYRAEHLFNLVEIAAILLVSSFVASYIPARKAGNLRIVDCLRHV